MIDGVSNDSRQKSGQKQHKMSSTNGSGQLKRQLNNKSMGQRLKYIIQLMQYIVTFDFIGVFLGGSKSNSNSNSNGTKKQARQGKLQPSCSFFLVVFDVCFCCGIIDGLIDDNNNSIISSPDINGSSRNLNSNSM